MAMRNADSDYKHFRDWIVRSSVKDMTIIVNDDKVFVCDLDTKRVDKIPVYRETYRKYYAAFLN